MPSISARAVQELMKRHTRTETICAPGAAPSNAPSKKSLPAAMPATCDPCAPETIPMFTNLFLPSTWTVNGTVSRTAVAEFSTPNVPTSKFSLYSRIASSPVKLLSAVESTHTVASAVRHRTANLSVQSPSRFTFEPKLAPQTESYSVAPATRRSASRKMPNWYVPSTAPVYVSVPTVKVPATTFTVCVMEIHDLSLAPSAIG